MPGDGFPRILIARLSAIGDTVLTLPVACALRRAFPDAFLAWVVERKSAVFVAPHECLDEVVTLERGWWTSPRGILQARRLLRRLRCAVSIDCQSMTKSALACWLSGARCRIGLRGEYAYELSPVLNNRRIQPRRPHVVDRQLELLRGLGIEEPQVEFRLPVPTADQQQADRLLQAMGLAQFAVINPGATWDSRLWEMDRFGQVAQHLGQRYGLPTLVVWGSPPERDMARAIAAHSAGHARPAPPTSLTELAAVVRRARLFVSSDTGPLHIAVAVGTPSVALHGPTLPERSGPYGPPHQAVQVVYQDGSRRQRRQADNWAMRAIEVAHVTAACDRLLAATNAASGAA